jgi:hypothetical protein
MEKNRSPAHICTPDQSACIPYHADCITKLKGLLGTAILLFINPGLTPWATNMASVS